MKIEKNIPFPIKNKEVPEYMKYKHQAFLQIDKMEVGDSLFVKRCFLQVKREWVERWLNRDWANNEYLEKKYPGIKNIRKNWEFEIKKEGAGTRIWRKA